MKTKQNSPQLKFYRTTDFITAHEFYAITNDPKDVIHFKGDNLVIIVLNS